MSSGPSNADTDTFFLNGYDSAYKYDYDSTIAITTIILSISLSKIKLSSFVSQIRLKLNMSKLRGLLIVDDQIQWLFAIVHVTKVLKRRASQAKPLNSAGT